jgi:hypothetical protein
MQSRWRFVHLIRWEEVNGPVPGGMKLKCLDGDRTNTDPDNWEAIPQGMLPKLTRKRGFDHAPQELKPTLMALAKLDYALDQRTKKEATT